MNLSQSVALPRYPAVNLAAPVGTFFLTAAHNGRIRKRRAATRIRIGADRIPSASSAPGRGTATISRRVSRIVGTGICRMMARHLAKRRPGGTGGDVLAAATGAAQAGADLRYRQVRPELSRDRVHIEYGVMPASVAPAEDVDILLPEFTQQDCLMLPILRGKAVLFQAAHYVGVLCWLGWGGRFEKRT